MPAVGEPWQIRSRGLKGKEQGVRPHSHVRYAFDASVSSAYSMLERIVDVSDVCHSHSTRAGQNEPVLAGTLGGCHRQQRGGGTERE